MLIATRLRLLGAGGCSSGWHVHLHREHRPQSAHSCFLHPHVLEGSIFSHLQPHFLHFLQVEHVPRLHRQRPMTTAQAGRGGGSKWKICVVKESVCALLKSGSCHRIINCSMVKLMRGPGWHAPRAWHQNRRIRAVFVLPCAFFQVPMICEGGLCDVLASRAQCLCDYVDGGVVDGELRSELGARTGVRYSPALFVGFTARIDSTKALGWYSCGV